MNPAWAKLFPDRQLSGKIPDKVKPHFNNGVSDWIGPQKGDTHPILYVSSVAGTAAWSEEEFNKLTGINTKCFSYAYCGLTSPLCHKKHVRFLRACLKGGSRIFMDSGAHTLHRILRSGKTLARQYQVTKDQRTKFVEYLTDEFLRRYCEYIRWCYVSNKVFDFWVTLDSKKQCSLIYKTTKKIEKMVGIAPVPVYHGDDTLDWVKRYIDDGHKLICLGIDGKRLKGKDARHRYYSSVFELTEKHGVACHGLALTGDRMFRYNWYSVDSATHIKAASYGKILQVIPERHRVAQIHISEKYSEVTPYGSLVVMSKGVRKSLEYEVERNGFDLHELSKDINKRIMYNAMVLQKAIKINQKSRLKFQTWGALV